jgi:hypothetical protein
MHRAISTKRLSESLIRISVRPTTITVGNVWSKHYQKKVIRLLFRFENITGFCSKLLGQREFTSLGADALKTEKAKVNNQQPAILFN